MDATERESRRARAEERVEDLRSRGVVAVAVSFVNTAGVSLVKSVPLDRFGHVAAWGVGATPAFDLFGHDDQIAVAPDGTTPVGDLRMLPDPDRVVPLAASPGWAWAPASRHTQDGEPHAACSRSRLLDQVAALAERGVSMRAAFEVEWVLSAPGTDAFAPAAGGPAYGLARLTEVSDYARDLLAALADQGVEVEQLHPEYAPAQLELSVAAEDPVRAADTTVLVRETVRAVGMRHGFRTSFSPKVDVDGVGNGGHVHLSVLEGDSNLMAGGDGAAGMSARGESFTAGVLERLPGLMAIGAPSLASYLRLVPSHWAGVYQCWGLENREAAVRVVTGSAGEHDRAANVEVKCFDLLADPYLVLAGLLAAGLDGLDRSATLPAPVDVDPASMPEDRRADLGIEPLPTSLASALERFERDEVLAASLGSPLVEALLAVRRLEMATHADSTPEEVAAASRWRH